MIASLAVSLVNFRLELLKAMARAGYKVTALAPDSDPVVAAALQEIGVDFIHVPMGRTQTNPVEDFRTLWALWRYFRRARPDAVLAYTMKPVIYGCLAARLAGIDRRFALITGLGYVFTEPQPSAKIRALRFLSKSLYRRALAGAQRVFVYNPDDATMLLKERIVRNSQVTFVSGSGVDLAHFAASPIPSGAPIFLLIARLLWDKGIGDYAEAARIVRRRHPQTRIQLLGPFDANPAAIPRQEVEKWVAEGLIEYLGETRDVRPFLAECSVFVLPSYREGIPRSVLEAMATGRPIITTDAPGCREVVVEVRTACWCRSATQSALRPPWRLSSGDRNWLQRSAAGRSKWRQPLRRSCRQPAASQGNGSCLVGDVAARVLPIFKGAAIAVLGLNTRFDEIDDRAHEWSVIETQPGRRLP